MIFEYSSIHKELNFLCTAYKDPALSSGSIEFGITNYDGNGADIASSIEVPYYSPTQVSGSIDLTTLGLTEGNAYSTFFSLVTDASGSYVDGESFNLYMSQPVISTTLDESIANTSGSYMPTLNDVVYAGNTTDKNMFTTDIFNTGAFVAGYPGGKDGNIYFDGLAESLKWDDSESNFRFSAQLVVPTITAETSGSVFNTIHITDQATFGSTITADDTIRSRNNIVGEGNVISEGNMYVNYGGPDGDSYIYFYENSTHTGAYLQWQDGTNRFVLNKDTAIGQHLYVNGSSLYMRAAGSDGDGIIYFYEGGSQTGADLRYDDSEGMFALSHSIRLPDNQNFVAHPAGDNGIRWIGGATYTKKSAYIEATTAGSWYRANLSFGTGDDYDQTTDAVERMVIEAQGDVVIKNDLEVDGNIKVNAAGPNGDSYVYFYEGSETGAYLKYNNQKDAFEFSHPLAGQTPTIVPLYPNIRLGQFSWASTDEYVNNTDHDQNSDYCYVYLNMPSGSTSVTVSGYIKADAGV